MNLLIDKLKQTFPPQTNLTKQDLYDFYAGNAVKAPESGFFWYLYALKQEKVIKNIYADTYKLIDENLPVFNPLLESKLVDIHNGLSKLPLIDTCVWSSAWFNEFTIHQVPRSFILVEVEKEAMDSVFYHLRDMDYKDVFLLRTKTDEAVLDRYIFEADNPIIITKMISKSPIRKVFDPRSTSSLTIPRLEKILVDLYCEESLLRAYKGSEQYNIFENALESYAINFKTMFAYAQRRKKEDALKGYLFQHFQTELEQNLFI